MINSILTHLHPSNSFFSTINPLRDNSMSLCFISYSIFPTTRPYYSNSLKFSHRYNLYPSPLRSTDNYISLFINSITHSVFLSVIQFHLPLPPIVHILLSVSLPQLLLQFLLRLVLTNPSHSRLVLACSLNANIDYSFLLRR